MNRRESSRSSGTDPCASCSASFRSLNVWSWRCAVAGRVSFVRLSRAPSQPCPSLQLLSGQQWRCARLLCSASRRGWYAWLQASWLDQQKRDRKPTVSKHNSPFGRDVPSFASATRLAMVFSPSILWCTAFMAAMSDRSICAVPTLEVDLSVLMCCPRVCRDRRSIGFRRTLRLLSALELVLALVSRW